MDMEDPTARTEGHFALPRTFRTAKIHPHPRPAPRQAPGRCPRHRCAGADTKTVPVVCLKINTTNLWQSSALILAVNSLSLLQHIGCPGPHLGNSSAVCLEVALCMTARAGESSRRSRRWLWDVQEGDIPAGGTVAALSTPSPWQQAGDLSCSRAQPQGSVLEGFLPVIKKKAFFVIETERTLKLQLQQTNKLTFNDFPSTFVFVLAEALPESFKERGGRS